MSGGPLLEVRGFSKSLGRHAVLTGAATQIGFRTMKFRTPWSTKSTCSRVYSE